MLISNNTFLSDWKIMSGYPLISILMTVYNNESTIAESLNSIKKQTYTNWELIIINDGSKDNTLNLIKNFKSEEVKYNYEEMKEKLILDDKYIPGKLND